MSKRKDRRHGMPATLIAAVAAVVALAGPALAYGPGGVNDPVGAQNAVVIESGSDTTQFVMGALDSMYNVSPGCEIINPAPTAGDPQLLDFSCRPDLPSTITTENYHHTMIVTEPPLGSGNGQKQLCDITDATHTNPVFIDFARSSSGAPFSCTGVHGVAFAREGIAWAVWPKAGGKTGATKNITNLTTADLVDIYTCAKTNWNQFPGGLAGTIRPYTAQPGSGTRKTWDTDLGGITEGPCVIPVTENEVSEPFSLDNIAGTKMKTAIDYFSTAAFNFRHLGNADPFNSKAKAVLGSVGGIAPSNTNIQNLSYPFGRYVFNLFCDSTCPAAHGATSNASLNYMGVDDSFHSGNGWICAEASAHSADPNTGVNYATEIQNEIAAQGFVNIPDGPTGGTSLTNSFCREV